MRGFYDLRRGASLRTQCQPAVAVQRRSSRSSLRLPILADEENDFNIRSISRMAPGKPGPLDRQIPGRPEAGPAAWECLRKRCGLPRYAVAAGWSRSLDRSVCEYHREAARAIRAEVNGDLTPEQLDFSTVDDGLEGMAFWYRGGSERKAVDGHSLRFKYSATPALSFILR